MFSTMPITGTSSLRQKSTHLRQSASATSCGVVTTIARFGIGSSWQPASDSSPVPGGKSMIRQSSSPQSVSSSSCFKAPVLAGPRQITA